MRPPPFRLERVLRVRSKELDRAAAAFAAASSELNAARADADAARRRLEAAARDQQARIGAGLRAGEYYVTALGVDSVRAATKRACERELACEARSLEARRALLAARTRVRALEGLRDRRVQAERAWREKIAQAELDEVGARMASRREVDSR